MSLFDELDKLEKESKTIAGETGEEDKTPEPEDKTPDVVEPEEVEEEEVEEIEFEEPDYALDAVNHAAAGDVDAAKDALSKLGTDIVYNLMYPEADKEADKDPDENPDEDKTD